MLSLARGWTMDVDRGPDWLFVRLHGPDDGGDGSELADQLWTVMQQSFTHRLVLELDDLTILRSAVIGQLVMLQKRVQTHGGMLRLCGLSKENQEAIHACRLDRCFPTFQSRADAVMGAAAVKPR